MFFIGVVEAAAPACCCRTCLCLRSLYLLLSIWPPERRLLSTTPCTRVNDHEAKRRTGEALCFGSATFGRAFLPRHASLRNHSLHDRNRPALPVITISPPIPTLWRSHSSFQRIFRPQPHGFSGIPARVDRIPVDLKRSFIGLAAGGGFCLPLSDRAVSPVGVMRGIWNMALGARNLRGADRFACSWLGRMLRGNRATLLAPSSTLFTACSLIVHCSRVVSVFVLCVFVFAPLFGTSSLPQGFVFRFFIGVLVLPRPRGSVAVSRM